MRLPDEEVRRREKMAYDMFSLTEEPSVADVQLVLKANGGTMAPARLYAIRTAARTGEAVPARVDYSRAAVDLRKKKRGTQR